MVVDSEELLELLKGLLLLRFLARGEVLLVEACVWGEAGEPCPSKLLLLVTYLDVRLPEKRSGLVRGCFCWPLVKVAITAEPS